MESEEALTLEQIAEQVTEFFENNPKSFMLAQPQLLTAKKRDGGFTKKAHIGGEHFTPASAYAGKKGQLIIVFKPDDVADYQHVEMNDGDAEGLLDGFGKYVKRSMSGSFKSHLQSAISSKNRKSEMAKNEGKFETYADMGFGSW